MAHRRYRYHRVRIRLGCPYFLRVLFRFSRSPLWRPSLCRVGAAYGVLVVLVVFSFFIYLSVLRSVPADPAWLTGWDYRRSHVIHSASGAGTDYQVYIVVHYGSGVDSGHDVYLDGKCRSDFGDVRVTTSDGTTIIAGSNCGWAEENVTGDYAKIWFKIPDNLSASDATVYVYYGKTSASWSGNGSATFIDFDDFEDTDFSEWTMGGTVQRDGTRSFTGIYSAYQAGGALASSYLYKSSLSYTSVSANVWVYQGASDEGNVLFAKDNAARWQGVCIRDDTSSTKFVYRKDGSSDVVGATSQTAGWHRLEVTINGTNITGVVDGNVEFTGGYGTYLGDIYVGNIWGLSDSATWWDSFYIRKYVDPEPAAGSWGSEEASMEDTVVLNSPSASDTKTTYTVVFNYTPIFFEEIQNASLYTNESGVWQAVEVNASPIVNNTPNTISHTFDSSEEGVIMWNIGVWNSTRETFALSNVTFTLDVPPRYANVGANVTSVVSGGGVLFYGQGFDKRGLKRAWLSTNESGRWINYTIGNASLPWTKYSGNPVLTTSGGDVSDAFASVVKNGSTYHMYYSYKDATYTNWVVGHATSSDGFTWTKDSANNPVLTKGSSGKFDETRVYCPIVWIEGGTWHMLYTGRNVAGYRAVGYANSTDGITWTRQNGGDAVLEETNSSAFAYHQVEGWGLIKVNSTYYLWYNLVSSDREIGLATSTDLLTWTKDSHNPIFTLSDDYSLGSFCVCPFKWGDYYYLLVPHYTSGTDYTEFDLYWDDSPTFYRSDRTLLGTAIVIGTDGEWDDHDQDTPFVLTDNVSRIVKATDELWCYYTGEPGNLTWVTGLTNDSDTAYRLGLHYGSPTRLNGAVSAWTWGNFTWRNSSVPNGTTVGWRIFYEDEYGNVNGTSIQSFSIFDPVLEVTIDSDLVDEDLTDFPVLLHLSDRAGVNATNVTEVFDDIGDSYLKINVTDASNNSLYTEVEYWNASEREAFLWVKVPSVSSSSPTKLFFYYGSSMSNNTAYVGLPGSAVAQNVWSNNFVLVNHMMDGPSNSYTPDSSPEVNNGTKSEADSPSEVTGVIGLGQYFNGTDDKVWVDFGNDASLNFGSSTNFTLEGWVKMNGTERIILEKRDYGAPWKGYYIKSDSSGHLEAWCYASADKWSTSTTEINDDLWHYVVGTYNRTLNISAYVDGVLEDSNTIDSGDFDTTNDLYAGDELNPWSSPPKGILDELRVSNVTRSPAWVKASYYSGLDDLVGWGSQTLCVNKLILNWTTTDSALLTVGFNDSVDELKVFYGTGSYDSLDHVLDIDLGAYYSGSFPVLIQDLAPNTTYNFSVYPNQSVSGCDYRGNFTTQSGVCFFDFGYHNATNVWSGGTDGGTHMQHFVELPEYPYNWYHYSYSGGEFYNDIPKNWDSDSTGNLYFQARMGYKNASVYPDLEATFGLWGITANWWTWAVMAQNATIASNRFGWWAWDWNGGSGQWVELTNISEIVPGQWYNVTVMVHNDGRYSVQGSNASYWVKINGSAWQGPFELNDWVHDGDYLNALYTSADHSPGLPVVDWAIAQNQTFGVEQEAPSGVTPSVGNVIVTNVSGSSQITNMTVWVEYWLNATVSTSGGNVEDLTNVTFILNASGYSEGSSDDARYHYTFKWTPSAGFSQVGPSPLANIVAVNCSNTSTISTSTDFRLAFKVNKSAVLGEWTAIVHAYGLSDDSNKSASWWVDDYLEIVSVPSTLTFTVYPGQINHSARSMPADIVVTANAPCRLLVNSSTPTKGGDTIPVSNMIIDNNSVPVDSSGHCLKLSSSYQAWWTGISAGEGQVFHSYWFVTVATNQAAGDYTFTAWFKVERT